METNPFRLRRTAPLPPSEPAAAPAGQALLDWIKACVEGQRWYVRAPLLLFMAWTFRGYLADPAAGSLFDGITLGFHEAGHAALMWFGSRMLTTAGGTIFQILIPVSAAAYLAWKQRDPFGALLCIFWLGTSLVGAGIYAGDARAQELPLVSPFGPIDVDSHDWTVMLMKYGMLSRDQQIGAFLIASGKAVMMASLGAGAWVLRIMATTATPVKKAPRDEPEGPIPFC